MRNPVLTGEGEAAGAPPEPSPEELAAAFADQLARTPVRDLLLQTMATFTDMAGVRLGLGPAGEGARDLTQARQAIETLRALIEVADRELGAAQARPFREPLAMLQMAYARLVEASSPGTGTEAPAAPAGRDSRYHMSVTATCCHAASTARAVESLADADFKCASDRGYCLSRQAASPAR